MLRVSTSSAEKVLISRATQCSFSSVFHLSKAGMSSSDFTQVKNIFKYTIIAPLIFSATVASTFYYFKK